MHTEFSQKVVTETVVKFQRQQEISNIGTNFI